jgi:putative hydrolase of HD superfamily
VTKEEKFENEKRAIEELKNISKCEVGDEICDLWHEYAGRKTREARFVYALDKIEGLISVIEAGHESICHPEYLPNYADESVREFVELKPMLLEVRD